MKRISKLLIGVLLMLVVIPAVFATGEDIEITNVPEKINVGQDPNEFNPSVVPSDLATDYWWFAVRQYESDEYGGGWSIYPPLVPLEDKPTVFYFTFEGTYKSVKVNDKNFPILEIYNNSQLEYEDLKSGAYYSKGDNKTIVIVRYDDNMDVDYTFANAKDYEVEPAVVNITLPANIKKGTIVKDFFAEKDVIFKPSYISELTDGMSLYQYDEASKKYEYIGWSSPIPNLGPSYFTLHLVNLYEIDYITINGLKIPFSIVEISGVTDEDFFKLNKSSAVMPNNYDGVIVYVYYDEFGNIHLPEPEFIEKPKDKFELNSKDEIKMKVDVEFDFFKEVKINGEVLDKKHYKATEGSTIITLNNDYLNSLKAGNYKIDINFTNGVSINHTLQVLALPVTGNDEKVPQTIDQLYLYIGLFFISFVALKTTHVYYKKQLVRVK